MTTAESMKTLTKADFDLVVARFEKDVSRYVRRVQRAKTSSTRMAAEYKLAEKKELLALALEARAKHGRPQDDHRARQLRVEIARVIA